MIEVGGQRVAAEAKSSIEELSADATVAADGPGDLTHIGCRLLADTRDGVDAAHPLRQKRVRHLVRGITAEVAVTKYKVQQYTSNSWITPRAKGNWGNIGEGGGLAGKETTPNHCDNWDELKWSKY